MLKKFLLGAERISQPLKFAASLSVYWISTFFGGRLRVRWARWAYALDHRNKLALDDLVERRPKACDGGAQIDLQRWALSIVERDPMTFVAVANNNASNSVEQARASLVDWAYRCPEHDAVDLYNLAKQGSVVRSGDAGMCQYPWAYLAQQQEVNVLLAVAERAASSDADRIRSWLARWAYSFYDQDYLTIHFASTGSENVENARIDAFYALVAARTKMTQHPQAHSAQRFMVNSSSATHDQSPSQNGQDRFVLYALGEERRGEGFFVEFGATDGHELSNTYLLEREFGWNGIVAEPNPGYQAALHRNRRCGISDHCVWRQSGEKVRFQVVDSAPALSTIDEFRDSDNHDRSRTTTIEVPTITLNDLLKQHRAPRQIDYISIDTEGSELAILEAFDFAAYDVSVFTIEHNFTPARVKILRLMQQQGYVRVFETISQWDDWYVRADLAARLEQPQSAERALKMAG
jgi:FkbM family methyltransferase